jgi:hypothetical protein
LIKKGVPTLLLKNFISIDVSLFCNPFLRVKISLPNAIMGKAVPYIVLSLKISEPNLVKVLFETAGI